jgi:hypothetical protein
MQQRGFIRATDRRNHGLPLIRHALIIPGVAVIGKRGARTRACGVKLFSTCFCDEH